MLTFSKTIGLNKRCRALKDEHFHLYTVLLGGHATELLRKEKKITL